MDSERFIELGLNRYSAGDLDGAILMWEEALEVDPGNARAQSYIEYVQHNYELIAHAEPMLGGDEEAFPIEEEPEYHIEITPGELVPPAPEARLDEVDSGWFDDESAAAAPAGPPPLDLELELEPPPLAPPIIEAREPDSDVEPTAEVSFEDRTREYQNARAAGLPLPPNPSDFEATPTGEFAGEETTGAQRSEDSFSGTLTEVRKRDFGFVQPVADKSEVTGEKTTERAAFSFDSTEDDLLAVTKPRIKRPVPSPAEQAAIETQQLPVIPEKTTKREMPEPRPPAKRDSAELSQAEVMLNAQRSRQYEGSIDIGAPTRDLGMRPPRLPQLSNPDDEDAPTKQSDARAIRAESADDPRASTRHDLVLAFDPIDARSDQILAEVDAGAPDDEPIEDRCRRRIGSLVERAQAWSHAGDNDRAVAAIDLALSEDPNSVLAQKLITRNRDAIMTIFQTFVGSLERQPQLAKPLHELQNAPISPRAAFLLSRVDGTLTIDELLDVSGMPRMEAYRYLCQLFLRGILR